MSNPRKQLLGISNAIVDVLGNVDPNLLEKLGAPPGSMTLVDKDQAVDIYALMGPAIESAGGSVANTIACFASLGGTSAYIGRVADDQFGQVFTHDMQSLGVDVRLPPETRQAPTARCHVLITPDGERTMQTYLGACVEIATSDIRGDTIGSNDIVLLDGYVWDTPDGPAAMRAAIELAKAQDSQIALSLSDSFCVERHLAAFRALVNGDADIIIGNEAETLALFNVNDVDTARKAAAANGRLFAMTRSEHGSEIIHGDVHVQQPADPIEKLVDATGAGDAWVAGFLYGMTHDMPLAVSTGLATRCATLAVQRVGARPSPDELRALLG